MTIKPDHENFTEKMTSQISPLGKISDYHKLLDYYNLNKEKPFDEWLEFDSTFGKPGKQGLTGLVKTKDGKKMVFKISQYINYLVEHEYSIMSGLNDLIPYCPHFCKAIGIISTNIDPVARKEGNPFQIKTKYPIEKSILLCEYIEKSHKLYNLIRAVDKVPENVLYSTALQVLLAVAIAQRKKRVSHYDLHSFNIMMKKCDENAVFLYVLDENNQFCVPTNGWYPVIIDFGFSYSDSLNDGPLYPSMGHTSVGFTSDRYDWVTDAKLFLVTVSYEIKGKRDTKMAKRFRRIVKNMFFPLDIEWSCGWDNTESDPSASDYVCDIFNEHNSKSKLFEEYDYYCIDILDSLIILPIEEQDFKDFGKSFRTFIDEWVKIENQITSPFYQLHILKSIVDTARAVRGLYTDSVTRDEAINLFKGQVYESLGKIIKFYIPKDVHYEKLLCSLYVLSKCIEGVYFKVMNTILKPKYKTYDRLPVKSIEQIFGVIQTNIPDGYNYSDKSEIIVYDTVKETTSLHRLTSDQAMNINELHPLCRGTALYEMIKNK